MMKPLEMPTATQTAKTTVPTTKTEATSKGKDEARTARKGASEKTLPTIQAQASKSQMERMRSMTSNCYRTMAKTGSR